MASPESKLADLRHGEACCYPMVDAWCWNSIAAEAVFADSPGHGRPFGSAAAQSIAMDEQVPDGGTG